MTFRLTLLSVFFIGSAVMMSSAHASPLSDAERAASEQRSISEAERAIKEEGCRFWGELTEPVEFSNGVKGWYSHVPSLQFLLLQTITRNQENPETFDISAFPALPNGGVGGKDFCTSVSIFNSTLSNTPDSLVGYLALILRYNLEFKSEYPNTSAAAIEANQYLRLESGDYALISVQDQSEVSVYLNALVEDSSVDRSRVYVRIGGVLMIPILENVE